MNLKRLLRQWGSFAIVSTVVVAFMAYMNYMTPLFADDFSYSVSFVTKEPFESFSQVLQSQYLHYFSTNGRTVVHTLAQVLLWIGKPALNWINAAAFLSLCILICFHGLGSFRAIKSHHIILVFAALWLLTPHFAGSYLWVMGSANYMYSPQIILLFLIPFRRTLAGEKDPAQRHPAAYGLIWWIFGIMAGWTNENTSLALIAMVFCILAARFIKKEKIPGWMTFGFLGNVTGAALLFASPAQAKRLSAAGGFGGLEQWLERFVSISLQVCRYFWVLILIFLIAAFVFAFQNKKTDRKILLTELLPTGIYAVGALICVYSMVGSPQFPIWAWSSILVFFLIAVMTLVSCIEVNRTETWRLVKNGLCIGLLIVTAVCFFNAAPELTRIKEEYSKREQMIADAAASGERLIVEPITSACTYSSYSLFLELNEDPASWPNNAIANYYDIPSIGAEKAN